MNNNEWIPIQQELPSANGKYLVSYREWSNGNYLPRYYDTYVRILKFNKSTFRFPVCVDKQAEADINRAITAWMHLPDIYRGDEE